MAKIDKIKLPDGVTYDVIDASKSGVYTVKGTQTKTTASWTGEIDVDALYDGLTIAYYLPTTSKSNVTLTLTLNNGTTTAAIPVYVTGETRMTTHYAAGSTIMLTYWSAGSISVNGTATTSARWTHSDYYISNTDTKVRQTLATGDTNRPLLMSYSNNTDTTADVDNVSYRNNSIYANPSTGTVTATKFVGDISGCTAGDDTVDIAVTYANFALDAFDAEIATEAESVKWENVQSKPTTLDGYGITDAVKTVKVGSTSYSPSSGTVSLPAYPTTLPASDTTSTYSATGTAPVNGKAVAQALGTLPEPMVFKGSLGTGGTITALPVNGTATIGDTYKVITAGTYASQAAKIGDVFICQTKTSSANTWAYVPSGDDTVADTWRNIKVNGTEKIGTGISTGAVDFVNGTNTTVSYNATGNKISISATDTNDAVTQTATSTNSNYEVLFSGTADNTTRTESARKYSNFTFNPSTGTVTATKFVGDISGCTADDQVDITVAYALDAFYAEVAYTAAAVEWKYVQSKPTTLAGYGITDAVSTIAYDTTNKKFTKTINGTTTDVAKLATTSVGSASAGTAIPADDITAWTTNTPTEVTPNTVVTSASGATASVSGATLTITDGSFGTGASCSVTAGTAASLSYTAKSIPNISVSSKTVATGFTTS